MTTNAYLTVGGLEYSEDQAKAVIAGYALGTYEVLLSRRGSCKAIPQATIRVPRWGYRTYDCVRPSPGPGCEATDYLIAAGLNGRIDVSSVAALQAACPPAFEELSQIDESLVYWHLDEGRLMTFPQQDCPERHLWLAWCYMMSMPEIGVALTHKTLHHKRPTLFPLIDGRTVKAFDEGAAWVTIHRDINQHDGKPFASLEEWFAALAREQEGCVPLTRLRLHDILLWCRIMPGQEEEAARKGEALLQPY